MVNDTCLRLISQSVYLLVIFLSVFVMIVSVPCLQVDIISNREGEDGEEKAIFGIFIKNVVPESPAGNCGELQVPF